MVDQFNKCRLQGKHYGSAWSSSEVETKKQRIEELTGQLFHYDSNVTAYSILEALRDMEKSDKVLTMTLFVFLGSAF